MLLQHDGPAPDNQAPGPSIVKHVSEDTDMQVWNKRKGGGATPSDGTWPARQHEVEASHVRHKIDMLTWVGSEEGTHMAQSDNTCPKNAVVTFPSYGYQGATHTHTHTHTHTCTYTVLPAVTQVMSTLTCPEDQPPQ